MRGSLNGDLTAVEKARPYYNGSVHGCSRIFHSVRALIFDLDGTLIDSQRDLIHSVNAMLGKWAARSSTKTPSPATSATAHRNWSAARWAATPATQEERQRALKFFLGYYEDHKMDTTCAYPGVPEALAQLRATLPMAILTNKPVRISVRILDALGLAKYFRAIYGGNSFETKKPDPLGANTILREFGAAPDEAMLIGDSEVDIQTARNAGTLAAAVNYGFGTHDRTAHPADIYLDRLTDLVPLLGVGGAVVGTEAVVYGGVAGGLHVDFGIADEQGFGGSGGEFAQDGVRAERMRAFLFQNCCRRRLRENISPGRVLPECARLRAPACS